MTKKRFTSVVLVPSRTFVYIDGRKDSNVWQCDTCTWGRQYNKQIFIIFESFVTKNIKILTVKQIFQSYYSLYSLIVIPYIRSLY